MSNFGSKVLTGSMLAVIGLFAVKLFLFLATGFLVVVAFVFKVLLIALAVWLVVKAVKYVMRGSEKPAME
jgi:hypothetical protein